MRKIKIGPIRIKNRLWTHTIYIVFSLESSIDVCTFRSPIERYWNIRRSLIRLVDIIVMLPMISIVAYHIAQRYTIMEFLIVYYVMKVVWCSTMPKHRLKPECAMLSLFAPSRISHFMPSHTILTFWNFKLYYGGNRLCWHRNDNGKRFYFIFFHFPAIFFF